MAQTLYKCTKCDRSFKMAAHLGRHMSTMHGSGAKKTTKKKTKTAKTQSIRKAGRPKTRQMKKTYRPTGAAARLGLRNMGLDQLAQLIEAAREEARHKLAELEASIG